MLIFAILIFTAYLDIVTGVRRLSPEQPVSPNVTTINPTEIKATWCRVNSNSVEIDHYELFIDNELEYSGIDVMYVAKRLKPYTWYEVKLRACGVFPNRCSVFSRTKSIKTPKAYDNITEASPSSATLLTVIVVPSFIIGVIVGILVITLLMILKYCQSNVWLIGPVFELPQYVQQSPVQQFSSFRPTEKSKDVHVTDSEIEMTDITSNDSCNTTNKPSSFYVSSGITSDHLYDQLNFVTDENKENVINTETPLTSHTTTIAAALSSFNKADCINMTSPSNFPALAPKSLKLCEDDPGLSYSKPQCAQPRCFSDYIEDQEYTQVHGSSCVSDHPIACKTTVGYCLQVRCPSTHFLNSPTETEFKDTTTEALASTVKKENISECERDIVNTVQVCESTTHDKQCQKPCTEVGSLNATLLSSESNCGLLPEAAKPRDILVAIDNSNIYIGAQEYASSVNANDRKRNVRVKLQHLVKILERGRNKDRAFACGSSPPATETVWELYRRLGYTVDLEDRRGKDEQRVDEGLHLCIYKALCELPPSVLVLATGDGMRGKSEFATSFPGCAAKALERGWQVELHSWKHSLSAEWNKLAKKFPRQLTITYLDQYVNYITFVDSKNGRKCLPLPPEYLGKN